MISQIFNISTLNSLIYANYNIMQLLSFSTNYVILYTSIGCMHTSLVSILRSAPNHSPFMKYRCMFRMRHQIRHIPRGCTLSVSIPCYWLCFVVGDLEVVFEMSQSLASNQNWPHVV